MFTPPKLSKLADEAIKELQRNGIQVTPEEVLLFNKLGELAKCPDDFELLSFCYKSFGNLKVYPLTLGAKLWLQLFEKEHPFDQDYHSYAIIYAMANSRNIEAFNFKDYAECKTILYDFASKINLTESEIKNLICQITLEKIEGKKKIAPEGMEIEDEFTLIPALSILMNIYGKDTNYWLWHESEEICSRYIKEAIAIKTEKPVKHDDKSLLAFMEIKKVVSSIKSSRQSTLLVEPSESVESVKPIGSS